jgi:hypothetical protein
MECVGIDISDGKYVQALKRWGVALYEAPAIVIDVHCMPPTRIKRRPKYHLMHDGLEGSDCQERGGIPDSTQSVEGSVAAKRRCCLPNPVAAWIESPYLGVWQLIPVPGGRMIHVSTSLGHKIRPRSIAHSPCCPNP